MRHHEETIAAFAAEQADRADTLGVIVVGSVARGEEKPGSDVDVYVVITDEAYAAATAAGEVAYMSTSAAGYEGGYVDVKLASPHYLLTAAVDGDDPTRASFDRGRVVLDRIGDLQQLIDRMAELPAATWAGRVHSFRAQLALHGGYFLPQAYARGDQFLLRHSAVHAAFAAGRCVLARQHRLFRGQKYLAADLARSVGLPDGLLDAWSTLVDAPTPTVAHTVITILDAWLGGPLTDDQALSTFITDNELSWLRHSIPPEYW